MVGLGTEITFVMYKQRQMQSAADSAAHGAATALSKGYPANHALEAKAIAATGGFVDGAGGVVVTVNKPPASGNNTANAGAVEVIITQPQTLQLVSLFSEAAFNVGARAVAVKGASGNFCLLTTNTASATSLAVSNGATVNLNQCGAAVNSGGSAALSVTGGARLNTASVKVVGQAKVSNGGSIVTSPIANNVQINQAPTDDPYAGVTSVVPAGCNNNNKTINWAATLQTLNPGTFCNGLSIGNGAQVKLNPGVYYIKTGTFNIGGGTTVTGAGVTIVLTRNNTSAYAKSTIGNGANVTLSAPTTGTHAGIVFFGDRGAPTTTTNNFQGGSTVNLTGALYFPTQRVVYSNGSTTNSICTQIIAWRISFSGGVSINNQCESAGTTAIGGSAATTLVE
jgi:hypothetical protein